jgi:hypothetical protein
VSSNPVGFENASAGLTSATDARTTRLCCTLQSPFVLACRMMTHGEQSALSSRRTPDAAASTASRPAFVTIAKRPSLWDETAGDMEVIWGAGEAEYFWRGEWTTQISLNWFNKFAPT